METADNNRSLYKKGHVLENVPRSEQVEIYDKLYILYYDYIKYKQSDTVTERVLQYEFFLKRPRSARSLAISNRDAIKRLLGKSLWDLFSICNVDSTRSRIVRELPLSENIELINVRRSVRDRGLEPHVFEKAKLKQVLEAFRNKQSIEEVDIYDKVKDPLFRFITKDDPEMSVDMSETLHMMYKDLRTITPRVQKMATDKLKENADAFAVRMYDVIKQVQAKEEVTSFRETVRVLNENHIPSYRGGEWHLGSIQQLEKRWKSLGLVPDKLKPK